MSLTVVSGPMFAGKSTWIQNYVNRNDKIGRMGLVLRPDNARRYTELPNEWTTHDQNRSLVCVDVETHVSLMKTLKTTEHLYDGLRQGTIDFVVVDEAQFCCGLLELVQFVVEVCRVDLVLVGLSTDAERNPWIDVQSKVPEFLTCMALAEHHVHLQALCTHCKDGSPAIYTHKKMNSNVNQFNAIEIGSSDLYEPLCRSHYLIARNKRVHESHCSE